MNRLSRLILTSTRRHSCCGGRNRRKCRQRKLE